MAVNKSHKFLYNLKNKRILINFNIIEDKCIIFIKTEKFIQVNITKIQQEIIKMRKQKLVFASDIRINPNIIILEYRRSVKKIEP